MASAIYPGGGSTVSAMTTPPPPVGYASSARRHMTAPDYRAIKVGASVLNILGIVCLSLAGLAMVFSAFALLAGSSSRGSMLGGAMIGLPGLIYGGLAATYGAILMMLGSLGLAVRDIARNSFTR